ncbi:MAG: LemA family protein [Bacteroidetes bacterium]|nr:LemA family protein [Bacteroidota bacterium]
MRLFGIFIVLGLVALVFISGCNTYNHFVSLDEDVANGWSKVQSAYQRRADLIPNLVNTVKGAAEFEQSTLADVTQARARATNITIDPSKVTPEQLAEFQSAQSELSQALGRLLMVTENYPELRATENFRELQAQLEGTENRIKVERDRYNDVVTGYNKSVRRFPASFFANVFGFPEKGQFQAEQTAQDAPKVEF